MKNKKWFQKEAFKYAIYGSIFGCFFPIFGTLFDLIRLNQDITLHNIIQIQIINPIHFIIDTAPIFLGLFALIGGIKQDTLLFHNQEIIRISKVREEFFANISHEIRTPMNGVIGIVDVLKRTTDLNKTQKNYLNVISKSSNDMMSIINDILNFSKLEAGELTIEYTTNTIYNVIQQEINLFIELAQEKQNTIELVIDNKIPKYLYLGEIRVGQIIRNLLSNAIKFTENGNIIIKATLSEIVDSSYCIKIEVIDDGVGIKIEDQKRLFNIFQQLDQSSTKKSKGTGLGLSIAKKLAKLMHGEIGVQSEINKGSNFWFTFIAEESKATNLNPVQESISNNSFQNNKILLVDDMEINILVAEKMLLKLGFNVDTARNGLDAISKFECNDYHLILMDIQMPGMNGIEAAKRIRLIDKHTPPIIALSANAMQGDKENYISQGLDDYITKPVVLQTLQNILKKWVYK